MKFLILLKHWGYDNFELNWFHGLSKSLAILFSQVLDLFTLSWETSTKHPRSVRGNFIPILKITGDELPMELGVYGGCLLCPLYPLLLLLQSTKMVKRWQSFWKPIETAAKSSFTSFLTSGASFLRREAAKRATNSRQVPRHINIGRRTFLKVYCSGRAASRKHSRKRFVGDFSREVSNF